MNLELLHGDCLKVLPTLEAASHDLVVTSPPYNLGINYRSFDDTASRSDFLDWCRAWSAEVKRVLTDDGSFFLNVGAAPSNPLFPHQVLLALTDELFVLQNTFHWIKSITIETRKGEQISAGHFKPINSKRYVNDCHEYVFHLTKSGDIELDREKRRVSRSGRRRASRLILVSPGVHKQVLISQRPQPWGAPALALIAALAIHAALLWGMRPLLEQDEPVEPPTPLSCSV